MSDISAFVPYAALAISLLGSIGTVLAAGRSIGRVEHRVEALESAAEAHAEAIGSLSKYRERIALLEQGHNHIRGGMDGLALAIKEFRVELKEALREFREDMRQIMKENSK